MSKFKHGAAVHVSDFPYVISSAGQKFKTKITPGPATVVEKDGPSLGIAPENVCVEPDGGPARWVAAECLTLVEYQPPKRVIAWEKNEDGNVSAVSRAMWSHPGGRLSLIEFGNEDLRQQGWFEDTREEAQIPQTPPVIRENGWYLVARNGRPVVMEWRGDTWFNILGLRDGNADIPDDRLVRLTDEQATQYRAAHKAAGARS